jgi:hypothetical protein
MQRETSGLSAATARSMPQTSAIDIESHNVAVLQDIDSSKPERDRKKRNRLVRSGGGT